MPHTYTEPGSICPTASGWVMRADPGEATRLLVHLHQRSTDFATRPPVE